MSYLKRLFFALALIIAFQAGALVDARFLTTKAAAIPTAPDCNVVSVNGTTFMGDYVPADLHAVNGGSTGSTAGKLEITNLRIVSSSGPALYIDATVADDSGLSITGNDGVDIVGHNGDGIHVNITGNTADRGAIKLFGGNAKDGLMAGPAVQMTGGNPGSGDGEFGAPGLFVSGGYGGSGQKRAGPAIVLNTDIEDGTLAAESPNAAVEINLPSDWVSAFWTGNKPGVNTAVISGLGGTGAGDGIVLTPQGTGKAINALGQIYVAPTNTNDDALKLVPNGTGLPVSGLSTIVKGVAVSKYPIWMLTAGGVAVSGVTPSCKISKDGGAAADVAATPSASDARGQSWVALSATETNATTFNIVCTGAGAATFRASTVTLH